MSFAGRFSERAADYAAARPAYAEAALDALFAGLGDPARLAVADLGAGTGISSRQLAARGAHVFAVEPNAAMREAAEPHPGVHWIDGTAENTGLDHASVDLVTACAAFHWFDHARALDEMRRILRPGGRAALVSNERDAGEPFAAAYDELVWRFRKEDTRPRRAGGIALFRAYEGWKGVTRRIEAPNPQRLDVEGVLALARSSSHLPKEGPEAAALHEAIRTLVEHHAENGTVPMTLRTVVIIGDLAA